jgi:hypothetical protein
MTDDPVLSANPDHAQATSTKPSTATPSASSPIGDPARRGLGDKTDDESQRTDRSKGSHSRFEDESEDDGGEGHKGPRADAGRSPDSSGGESCGSDTDCKADGSTKK